MLSFLTLLGVMTIGSEGILQMAG